MGSLGKYVIVLAASAVVTFATVPLARRLAVRTGAIAAPGDRHVHATPTPRLGGLAMFFGLLGGIGLAALMSGFDAVFESPSNVLGVVHFRQVLPLLRLPGPPDLVELAREPRYVLETTPVLRALEALRDGRDHLLIVVDEHGVCEGLVTPIDVLEAVAGDLPEHQEDRPPALPLPDGSWLLDGRLTVDDAARVLDAPALGQAGPDATLAGFLLRLAGAIPAAGQVLEWGAWRFEITRRAGLRIEQARAFRSARADGDAAADGPFV